MDDQEDITRLRTDPKEWERTDVWQKLWGSATMAASRKLQWKSPDYVDDIAIQSITRVIEKLPVNPDIHKFGELRAFTASIAYHLSISHLRKVLGPEQGGGKFDPLDATDEKEDKNQISPTQYLQIQERRQLVTRTLTKLKPLNRNLLYDRYLDGMKIKDVASKYKMPIGTVGVYIQRALQEVRDYMDDDPVLLEGVRPPLVLILIFLIIS